MKPKPVPPPGGRPPRLPQRRIVPRSKRRALQCSKQRNGETRRGSPRVDAEKAEQLARSQEEYARRLISRELWAERLANVRSGRTTLTEARTVLAANRMDEEHLAKIESASLAVTETSARLAASSAVVAVEALTTISISTDGESRSLCAGESFESRIDGVLNFELNDVARVTVTGGSPELVLKDALERAEREVSRAAIRSRTTRGHNRRGVSTRCSAAARCGQPVRPRLRN